MKSDSTLPNGYNVFYIIDLKKDYRLSLAVNFIAVGICSVLYFIGFQIAPLAGASRLGVDQISVSFLLIGLVLYYIFHEFTHALVMGIFCRKPFPRFRSYGIFAYAGSQAFFDKSAYFIISFAPILLIGAILSGILIWAGTELFWSAYLLQIVNLASSSGDLFLAWKLHKMPVDTLIQDIGITKTFYTAQVKQ